MMSCLRSPMRAISIALVCLTTLGQAGCTTLTLGSFMTPGPDQPPSQNPPSGGSGGGTAGNVLGIATIVVLGGYLVYKLFQGEPEEGGEGENPGQVQPWAPAGPGGTF